MSTGTIVRVARGSDRDAVFGFCQNTFSWGDYIPRVWDSWLAASNGRTFVAVLNDKPIGLMNVQLPKLGEAWLRGARTHPDYRGRGVATALTNSCLDFARKNGARVARLITDQDNVAAQRVLEKLGFKRVSVFVSLECTHLDAPTCKGSQWANIGDEKAVWQLLRQSECFKRSAGLYTVLYTWYSLDKQDLHRFIATQKAIVHTGRNSMVDGLMLVDESPKEVWKENAVQTCYVDGDYDSAADMLRLLKAYCRDSKTASIHGLACDHPQIVKALKEAGFNTSDHAEIVYEKHVFKQRSKP